LQELGSDLLSVDATHNTTQYIGLQLFTIMVRDLWGHGALCGIFPIVDRAYFISDRHSCCVDADTGNNNFFSQFVKTHNPQIVLVIIMTDCDQAQMNAITTVYPGTTMLLCWWHVLHVIWMHFHTDEFPQLWE